MSLEGLCNERMPAVAGTFYPQNRVELLSMIDAFLEEGSINSCDFEGEEIKAFVLPHAGYIYSGRIAASAYVLLRESLSKAKIKRVILLGPTHRVFVPGIVYDSSSFFTTPLGKIKVHRDSIKKISDFPFVLEMSAAYEGEHSLEVHLPFLQRVLDDFQIVPLLVGGVEEGKLLEVLKVLIEGHFREDGEVLIVVSTDLSHFLSFSKAREKDRATSKMIENLDYKSLSDDRVCGAYPLRGFLRYAKEKAWKLTLIEQGDSSCVNGDRDRVVGYASYLVTA